MAVGMGIPKITPVILCGGSGTRLWPRSRPDRPKPFVHLVGDQTLFERTLARTAIFEKPVIVAGEAHADLVEQQLRGFGTANIVVEPEGKSTAAAIGLAANLLPPDTLMLVCPSDHYVGDHQAFAAAVQRVAAIAEDGWLACVTAKAVAPETRFGYVKRGRPLGENVLEVEQFVEKPSLEAAQNFVASGEYGWNTGIFVARADIFLAELDVYRPEIARETQRAVAGGEQIDVRFLPERAAFQQIVAESVDYAIFENTRRAAMTVSEMRWSDIGDWPSVKFARSVDRNGNCAVGNVEMTDCGNVMVDTDGPNVVCEGLRDLVVIVDGNDILVKAVQSTNSEHSPADAAAIN